MRLTTEALIIRENNNIGEADRFVTALTRELGVVRASARGARNLKSRNASATQLLSYSCLLYTSNEKDVVRHQLVQRIIQAYEKYEEGKRVRNYGKAQSRN